MRVLNPFSVDEGHVLVAGCPVGLLAEPYNAAGGFATELSAGQVSSWMISTEGEASFMT